MTTKVVGIMTVAIALLSVAPAWAQVEHAQRVALEVAIRRAQVRAVLCEQQRLPPDQRQLAPRLPASPPVGTAGPVALGDCSKSLWPFGR